MAYSWTDDDAEDGPHPKLEPISAWLFREAWSVGDTGHFLAAGGEKGPQSRLFSMAIGGRGFNPDDALRQHAWRALAVQASDNKEHLFSKDILNSLVSLLDQTDDPRIYVLPVAEDGLPLTESGATDTEALRERDGLGDMNGSFQELKPPKAIIGIIDHGINIFHQRFRCGSRGSRVLAAWFQGEARNSNLPFGREWTGPSIERALAQDAPDEDALLRRIGADFERPGFHPLARRSAHGTHVADLAAGMDPNDPEAEYYPIIAVNLPPEVARETSGSMLTLPFVLGVEYILDRARRYMESTGHAAQVFINFSFGLSGGPRVGLHRLEQTIHRAAQWHMAQTGQTKPPVIVVPAGNRNLARGHAQGAPGAEQLQVIWHIQPGDPTANYLEFRVEAVPQSITDLILVVTPPNGAPISTSVDVSTPDLDAPGRLLVSGEQVIGRASAIRFVDGIVVLTLALAPTDPGPLSTIAAASGDWQISVSSAAVSPTRIDAWILRDDVPHGFQDGGRQSYFLDPLYQDRDETGAILAQDPEKSTSTIRRAGSFNAIATGAAPSEDCALWVVGGYNSWSPGHQPTAAPYSGTPLDNGLEHVHCIAQSDRSCVRSGILAAGTRSGSKVSINGTSVAAPQLTRWLAMGKELPEQSSLVVLPAGSGIETS